MSSKHDLAHQDIVVRLAALEGGPPATQPIVAVTNPQFAASGATLKVGVPVTRVAGTYNAGSVTSRWRTRGQAPNEVVVANSSGADYTPVADDSGQMMTYYEQVTNPVTGEVKTFASGSVGPILPPDPTEPGEVEDFDFTSGTAHSVTVARSGTNATRRSGAATVEVMAANTKRYEHNAAGSQIGLWCEKARTNLFTNSDDIAAATSDVGSATVDDNYGTAPDGTTSSTRVQASGVHSQGVGVAISGVTGATRFEIWAKGANSFYIRDPDSGEYTSKSISGSGWQLVAEQGTGAPPANHYNWMLYSDGTDLDIELWGAMFQPGSAPQSLVHTTGSSGTRPKEVWTVTLAVGSVTRDIQIEDDLGQVQNFTGQVIGSGATWQLDADNITIRPIIAKLRVYTNGTLGSSPPSSPPPPPPPPPGDYPTMTMAALIDTMENADDGLKGGGLPPARQAAIQTPINYLGCKYLSEYPRTDGLGSSDFYLKWNSLAFWLWMFLSDQHTATGKRIQYRRMTPFILLDGPTGDWYTGPVHDNMGGVGQSVLWEGNQDRRTPQSLWDMQRQETSGGSSVLLTGAFGIEMWANPGFYAISDQAIMQRAFAGAGVVEIRVINDDGTEYNGTDAKPLVALGGDHYCTSNPNPFVSYGLARGADGFKGRWKAVDCSGGWTSVGFVTVDFCFKKDGPRPPWGNYSGSWDITSSAYNLTKAQLQANPPPFVSG